MALRPEDKRRSIIPRWRSFKQTLASGELDSSIQASGTSKQVTALEFATKIREWRENKTLSFARELVGAAVVHNRHEDAHEAAQFILRSEGVSTPSRHLAEVVLGKSRRPTTNEQLNEFVRIARNRTRFLPRNPLPWVDLALGYTILGKQLKARRSILVAIDNASNSRFVLRAAARFFVHNRELDAAHDILCNSESIRSDPWLLASEIAIASQSGRRPRFVKMSRRLLNEGAFHEKHLNELFAALGTVELESGRDRSARQFFRRALKNPSENVVAQVRWAVQRGLTIELLPEIINLPKGFEARAWHDLYLKQWESSVANAADWLDYQQFSSSPALLGSYVSAVVLEDHHMAVRMIQDGLRANPSNPMLLNNLAYSSACLGEFAKTERVLKSIRTSGDQIIHVYKLATTGLLKFRQGFIPAGRYLYSAAADKADRVSDRGLIKRLLTFWALEEMRAGGLLSEPIPERAIDMLQSDNDPVAYLLVDRLKQMRNPKGSEGLKSW